MRELVTKYFEDFSNKDLEKLSDIFSGEITLQDWDILAEGKQNVLGLLEALLGPWTPLKPRPLTWERGKNRLRHSYALEPQKGPSRHV